MVSLFREDYWVWYGNPLRSSQSAMHIPLRMERNVSESNWPFVKWIKPATTTIECSMADLLFRCQRDAFNHLGCVEMRTWFTVDKILQQLGRQNIYSYVYNLLGIFTCTLYIYIYIPTGAMACPSTIFNIWVFTKIVGKPPKMDGENKGKPYEQMDDLGGFTTPIFGLTPIYRI